MRSVRWGGAALALLMATGCEQTKSVLDDTYYGNTIGQWMTALLIAVAAVVLGRILYWLSSRIVKRMTAKTETDLNDVIVDRVEEPVVFAVTVLGVHWGLSTLNMSETAHLWLGRIIHALVIFAVAWMLTRLFDAFVQHFLVPLVEKTEGDLDDQLLPIVRRGVKGAIWIVAIVVALNNAGYDVGALIAGLGIGGLAFALAAQDTISNLFGGFTIFTDRPFTIRDRIKVAGFDGTVDEIGVRSTRIRTLEGRLVTIPNSKIASAPVENVTSEPGRKVVFNLGLTYDTPPDRMNRAMEVVKEILTADEDIKEDPVVGFTAFGASSMDLLVIYWIKPGSAILDVQTRTNMAILERFNAEKLEFAYPTQTLFTKKLD